MSETNNIDQPPDNGTAKRNQNQTSWSYHGISLTMPADIGACDWCVLREFIEIFRPQNVQKPKGQP